MKKKLFSTLFALVLVLSFSLVTAVPAAAGTIIEVDPAGVGYTTIQDAIDEADPGDTILVVAGAYVENIVINESNLTVKSLDKHAAVIDGGGGTGIAVKITASNVTLSGFIIENAEYGIDFDSSVQGCTVEGNKVQNISDDGIRIFGAGSNKITGNEIANITDLGIYITTGASNIITNNYIHDCYFAIEIWGAEELAKGNKFENNTIENNDLGIVLFGGSESQVIGNLIQDQKIYHGIMLQDTYGNTIKGNTIKANAGQGIRFVDASNNTIVNNSIESNDIGLYLKGSSGNNGIHDNNIIGNTQYGINNEAVAVVDATMNWWGHATGADHADNPHGTGQGGDVVSDKVDFIPWYATATTTPDTDYVSVDHPTPAGTIIAYSDTIQGGIDAAVAGDIITVAAGTYTENVIIGKSVTLQGDGSYPTIHDNGARPIGIQAGTSSVTIKGFTIVHAAATSYGAIHLVNDAGNHISNLTIEDNKFTQVNGAAGIWIEQGTFDGVTIKDNVMSGLSDTGVMIMASMTRLNFQGNTITGTETCTKGLYVQLLTGTALSDNAIHDNTITGFTHPDWPQGRGIEGSDNDYVTVSGNRLNGNYDGISWWIVTNISITNNKISDNGRFGICIKGQNLQMMGNTLENNGDSGINVAEYSIPTQDVDIHFNNLVGNAEFGVRADGTDGDVPSETVDATRNWWGTKTGPYHATANPGVTEKMGNAVSDNVNFSPWLYETQENFISGAPCYAGSVVLGNVATVVTEAGETSYAGGWNTFSTPIYLDDLANSWKDLYDLTSLDYSLAYRFDSVNQKFEPLATTDEYAINPGEGFFIKMKSAGSLPILCSTEEKLMPPSRALTEDWNLIGLANMGNMPVKAALSSIVTAPGLAGYGPVVSPIGNVSPGAVLADGMLYVGEGYWVYMLGARTLAGFTMTPVDWMR